ncbi:MAG: hypothetical protein RIR22_965 [Planctomycetota bacterium]|jgi:hypothetical protein
MDAVEHTKLHTALNQHLDGIGKYVKGEWVTMWARKGNSKDVVTTQFSQSARLKVLDQFYKHYAEGKYYQYFIAERKATLASGAFR